MGAEVKRLGVEDFRNSLFDSQKIVRRTIGGGRRMADETVDEFDLEAVEPRREVIEGVTFTDSYNQVGFTYDLGDGTLTIKNLGNQILFSGVIASTEDFEKALKKADKKQSRLTKRG